MMMIIIPGILVRPTPLYRARAAPIFASRNAKIGAAAVAPACIAQIVRETLFQAGGGRLEAKTLGPSPTPWSLQD